MSIKHNLEKKMKVDRRDFTLYHKEMVFIGSGGHADEVKAIFGLKKIKCFVEKEYIKTDEYAIEEFDSSKMKAIVVVGDSKLRKKLVSRLPLDTTFFNLIHETAQIYGSNIIIGEGSYIGPNCVLTENIKIGKHALLNRNVQISHNTIIGDYFSAMPSVCLGGDLEIGDNVYMGLGATCKDKLKLWSNIIIGAGANVVKNSITMDNCIYAENPARIIGYIK